MGGKYMTDNEEIKALKELEEIGRILRDCKWKFRQMGSVK